MSKHPHWSLDSWRRLLLREPKTLTDDHSGFPGKRCSTLSNIASHRFEKDEIPNKVPRDPVVSVYMLAYQHADYVKQAIESVLIQKTNFPFEICVGEDASSDGTREICMQLAEKIRLFLRSRSTTRNAFGADFRKLVQSHVERCSHSILDRIFGQKPAEGLGRLSLCWISFIRRRLVSEFVSNFKPITFTGSANDHVLFCLFGS